MTTSPLFEIAESLDDAKRLALAAIMACASINHAEERDALSALMTLVEKEILRAREMIGAQMSEGTP